MSTESGLRAGARSEQTRYQRRTLADVARDAGVHKATASRALRGLPGVDSLTRARVLESARRLNYSASAVATALATGRSHTVGLVLPTLRWWYFSEVAAGASEVLTGAGYRVELISLGVDSDLLDVDAPAFGELLEEFGAGYGRDALLFPATVAQRSAAGQDPWAAVPAAVAGTHVHWVRGLFVDHRQGGRLVGRHLAELAHADVAVLDGRTPGKPDVSVWEQRTQGFLELFPQATIVTPGDCHVVHGHRAMADLIRSGARLPTAIFCHTDDLAFGVMAAMRRAGLRVPEDISIAAFDDHPMSEYWGLTTVSQHAYEQGVQSALALLAAMDVPTPTLPVTGVDSLEVALVVRETTAARAPRVYRSPRPDRGARSQRLGKQNVKRR